MYPRLGQRELRSASPCHPHGLGVGTCGHALLDAGQRVEELLEEAAVHLAVAVRRPRDARLKNSRFVTAERKSWVPLNTATQRSSPSSTQACVVAYWHVSTFVTPKKHLYSQDNVGTEFSQYAAHTSLAYWMVHASSPSAMEG